MSDRIAEQNRINGDDPLVKDGLRALDRELFGEDPIDRVERDGEPGPSHGADGRTERDRDPFKEFVDPGPAMERDGEPGVDVEADLTDMAQLEKELLEGL